MLFKIFFLILILCLQPACRTQRTFPPADLTQPGWQWFSGQAAWQPGASKQEVNGDLLLGWRGEAESTLEFSKGPFVIVNARAHRSGWELSFPAQGRHYSFPGTPPKDVIWFELLRVLRGESVGKKWSWQASQAGWCLAEKVTEARLEGYLLPATNNSVPGESTP